VSLRVDSSKLTCSQLSMLGKRLAPLRGVPVIGVNDQVG